LKVIDTLTTGFSTVTRKLWLVTVPIALDIFLWIGPKVSIGPVIDQMLATFQQAMAALPPMNGVDADLAQMLEMAITEMRNTVGHTNLLVLLGWGRLGVPGIAGIRPIDPAVDRVVEIASYGQMVLAEVVILAVGLLIACVFLGMLAQVVRGERLDLGALAGAVPLYWLRTIAVLVPLGIGLVLVVLGSAILGPFAFLAWALILWLLIYVSFFPQAITISGQGPWAAVWQSFNLVRHTFWSCLGLIILTNVIGLGMSLILRLLMGSPLGMAVAILANAYLGTGLTMAMFIFYRDRIEHPEGSLEQTGEQRS